MARGRRERRAVNEGSHAGECRARRSVFKANQVTHAVRCGSLRLMRVAALYDIHGNLPALEAVLEDVRRAGADHIVVGGDVVPGPLPIATLRRVLALDLPAQFIHGNCELAMLALMNAPSEEAVTYWGTSSGAPLPEQYRPGYRWTAREIQPEFQTVIASWPKTVRLWIAGLGDVLFCHGTPRSETELFTRESPPERLLTQIEPLGVSVVVCGHTHMQFDRRIGSTRVVNAGSVGMPFGEPGAYWAMLGPEIELRRTSYDLESAAARLRATAYPQAGEDVASLLKPPTEREMLDLYGQAEAKLYPVG